MDTKEDLLLGSFRAIRGLTAARKATPMRVFQDRVGTLGFSVGTDSSALQQIDALMITLRRHFGIETQFSEKAARIDPRR